MLGYTRTSDTNQTDLRCPMYPSPSFLSKNQLAKEGPDSVAPVVIPALVPTLDKSLRGLSPSRKVLIKTSHLPPSPHGSSRL